MAVWQIIKISNEPGTRRQRTTQDAGTGRPPLQDLGHLQAVAKNEDHCIDLRMSGSRKQRLPIAQALDHSIPRGSITHDWNRHINSNRFTRLRRRGGSVSLEMPAPVRKMIHLRPRVEPP